MSEAIDFISNLVYESLLYKLLFSLTLLILLDYITGITAVFYTKQVNSKVHFKGVIKKISILLSVSLGMVIDMIFGTDDIFSMSIILLLSSNEALSIIENLGKMDIPIPKFIKDALIQLKDNSNNGNINTKQINKNKNEEQSDKNEEEKEYKEQPDKNEEEKENEDKK